MKSTRMLLLLWIIVFSLIYIVRGSETAAAAVLMAVIYALFALAEVSRAGTRMDVAITCGGFAEKDDRLSVDIELKNKSRFPIALCIAEMESENILTGEKKTMELRETIGPKSSKYQELYISDRRCGRDQIEIVEISIFDGMRLFSKKTGIHAHAAANFSPTIEKLTIPGEYLNSYNMESYEYSQHCKGSDLGEVFGIREYTEGDSLKAIHWKLSAKLDDIMVRVPSYPIENNIIVLLDNSLGPDESLTPDQKSELVDLFFSISYTLLENGVRHSIGWYDDKSGHFEISSIMASDDMWSAISEMLGSPFVNSVESTVQRFIEALAEDNFTNHFLVTAGEERDADVLEKYGAVRIFRSAK